MGPRLMRFSLHVTVFVTFGPFPCTLLYFKYNFLYIYIFTPIKNIILIYLISIQPLTLTDLNIINLVNFYIISLYLIFSLKITSTVLDILSLFVVGDANH
jgi:hypothetical protein